MSDISVQKRQDANRELLDEWLPELRGPSRSGKSVQYDSLSSATAFRELAVIAFALDGDVAGFHRNLFSAVVCRLFFMTKIYEAGIPYEDEAAAVTANPQLFDALACQSREMANAITRYQMPPDDDWDRDRDRLRLILFINGVLSPRVVQREEYRELAIDGWVAAAESGDALVAAGIQRKDSKPFLEGIGQLVKKREDDLAKRNPLPWESTQLHIEALGLLWLARDVGLKFDYEHRLVPRELQRPHGLTFNVDGLPVLDGAERRRLDEALQRLIGDYEHPYQNPGFLSPGANGGPR